MVSVIVPTYNGEKFLGPAVHSILQQSLHNFELIVVDDGSTDGTQGILAKLRDGRLRVVTNPRNLGIALTTNKGIALARGKYVALQDHDDLSSPNRLQQQVDFLESHNDVALVGGSANEVDECGVVLREARQPTNDLDLKWGLLFGCCFHHTSVMIRRAVLEEVGGYRRDPSFLFAPDYDLLSRIASRYRVANLSAPIASWRRHSGNTSTSHLQTQRNSEEFIAFRNISGLMHSRNGKFSRECEELKFEHAGLRAFLLTPAGQMPNLPPRQVISGLRFLFSVQEAFYQAYGYPRSLTARHRRLSNWKWARHAMALGVRAPWNWKSKAQILAIGLAHLGVAVQAWLPAPRKRLETVNEV